MKFKILAQDFKSPFIRNYIWVKGVERLKELYIDPFIGGIISEKDDIIYFGDLKSWENAHKSLLKKIEKDMYYFDKIIDKIIEVGKSSSEWTKKNIHEKDLSKLSNKELVNLMNKFVENVSELYKYGLIQPLLDFQDHSYVEYNLRKFLDDEKFEIFTFPDRDTFAQEQEIELLKLMIENKVTEKELKKHAEKYGWIYYWYIGPAYTAKDFKQFLIDNPEEKLKEIQERKKKMQELKEKYIKDYKDEFQLILLKLAGKFVWAKPTRKDYETLNFFYLEKLIKEISKRTYLSMNQARSIPPENLLEYLENPDTKKINSIYKKHVVFDKIMIDTEADKFISTIEKEEIKDQDEFKGQVAFKGDAKGVVKVINKPEDMQKMKQGDILVSVATNPTIVPAMKKASAIVTD